MCLDLFFLSELGLELEFFFSPNSGYTEGVLTVSVKAGVRSGYALWARGFVCAGMPF